MEALERFDYGDLCRWCSNPADSAEHKYKRSDVVSEFGRPPYHDDSSLVRFVEGRVVADNLRGPASGHFKFRVGLCRQCNSTRSQPFDRGYESLTTFIRLNEDDYPSKPFNRSGPSIWSGLGNPAPRRAMSDTWSTTACCRLAEARFRIGSDLLVPRRSDLPGSLSHCR